VECEACHSAVSWSELSRFNHSQTGFPLSGAHQVAQCNECHKSPNPTGALANTNFKTAPTKCEGCHENIHGAQFAKAGVTPCASCHDSTRWKPSLFDHDKETAFALQGAHRNVRCEACHKLIQPVNGKAVLFYRPTPKDCSACHGSDVPKQSASRN
jgi:hypothetical protein